MGAIRRSLLLAASPRAAPALSPVIADPRGGPPGAVVRADEPLPAQGAEGYLLLLPAVAG